jgi:hypothetical protein
MDRWINNIQAYSTVTSQCATLISLGTCTAGCKAVLTTMASTLGCCTTPALGLQLAALSASGIDIPSRINSACGLNLATTGNFTLVGSCSKYLIAGTLAIKNFIYSYYTANSAAVIAAIKADLALKLGVSVGQISINTVVDGTITGANSGFATQATTAAVSVSYTVSPTSTSEANSINSALSTQLSIDTTLSTTSALDLTSREDSTSPASADATASSQTTITNPDASDEANSGMRTGVSMVVMVAAMAFALLL